jgi:hypothetical protein
VQTLRPPFLLQSLWEQSGTLTIEAHACRGSAREGCYQKAVCGRWKGAIGQHSTAGTTGRGVPNGEVVLKTLHGCPWIGYPVRARKPKKEILA